MLDNQISWEFADAEVVSSVINDVENQLGIKFPKDFFECALKNHGGHPSPDIFDVVGRGESVFNYLLSFDENSNSFIIRVYDMIKDRLVDGVYPIADDPFGNHICFDYRVNGDSPTAVFWDHELAYENPEKGLFPICNTFGELFSKLYIG